MLYVVKGHALVKGNKSNLKIDLKQMVLLKDIVLEEHYGTVGGIAFNNISIEPFDVGSDNWSPEPMAKYIAETQVLINREVSQLTKGTDVTICLFYAFQAENYLREANALLLIPRDINEVNQRMDEIWKKLRALKVEVSNMYSWS